VIRVSENDTVTIRWTTDEATSVHLHGYDIETSLHPGATALMTFEAYATGRFPIATHGFGRASGVQDQTGDGRHEEAVLLYLEVRPR